MAETTSAFLSDSFEVPWSQLTADRVNSDIESALAEAERRVDTLCGLDRGRMEFNDIFVGGFEHATEQLNRAWGLVSHLDSVCNSDELREAYNAMIPKVTEFSTKLYLNESLWDLLKTYNNTEEVHSLDDLQKRLLEETMEDFRGNGADLPEVKRQRLKKVEELLAKATQKFSENVLDSTNAWELIVTDSSRLKGLPDSAVAAALQAARDSDHGTDESPAWKFTLQFPSFAPILDHADDESLRKEIWEARTAIARTGEHENSDLVWEILQLRQEKAELLGKANFADLTTARRMAKSGENALSFVEDLHRRVVSSFNRETAELQEYKAEKTSTPADMLQPWEISYWAEKRRKELYDFDDEELRPYFPIDGVINGMFQIAEKLFKIQIVERESEHIETGSGATTDKVEVWHEDVKFYEIRTQDDVHLGSFYADWHPRAEKRSGAWMNFFRTGCPPRGDDDRQPHLGLICGNLTPPVGNEPALLKHSEVETIFHEFGHLIHHLLGEVGYRALNGIHVAWDFVELPSQFMENFCWDRESLDFFARHHETGEPIPARLFKKMLAARNYLSASVMMRQLSLGKLDLELHINYAGKPAEDLDRLSRTLLADYQMPTKTEPPSMARHFTHLFAHPTGYGAGYYSYKWAEVLDADAFTRFQKEGVLNPETGLSFRNEILSRGSSEEPDVLFRNFMGRDPDLHSLLKRSGLTS